MRAGSGAFLCLNLGKQPRAPAKGAGSVLWVAQQTRGAPQPLLPAGHPHGRCFSCQPWVTHQAQRMVPGSSELPWRRRPAHAPHGGRQRGTITLRGERVSGTMIQPVPLPMAMPSASPSTHPAAWKAKPCRLHSSLPQLCSGWWHPARDAIWPRTSAACPASSQRQPWQVPLAAGSAAALPGF